jgi:DNA polymerase II large subunit
VTESELNLPKHSVSYAQYFEALTSEVDSVYRIAEEARSKGYDPTTEIEIPPAHDVAARVEVTLQGPVGVAKRIRELSEEYETREEVAFAVAKEIALGELGNISNPEKAADKAVRVALAIMTESITAAPIEGIAKVQIHGIEDDRYLALYLAGPIRAAGGTETAMTVLVADYVRQVLGLPAYVATEQEVERALEEVELYARNVHLQYPVQPELVRLVASKLPIMLTGEQTEDFEVTGSRDLKRIEGNRVRGGAVLVLSDGLVGRATKIAKNVSEMSIKGWEWLEDVAAQMSKVLPSETDALVDKKLKPKSDYLTDVIGGRPVFSHPSHLGGFRLRYGRSRNTGLAGVGVHPATMLLVDEFLATGTHIRTERPGKGSIVAPVDTIEGPIVLLRDGSLRQVFTVEQARKLQGKVDRIVYLGDILVGLGEFLENNHPLVPSGYCEEWWSHDLERAYSGLSNKQIEKLLADVSLDSDAIDSFIESPLKRIPSPEEALAISEKFSIPLHPRYLYRWPALDLQEMLDVRSWILTKHTLDKTEDGDRIALPNDERHKTLLENLGIPHELFEEGKRIRLTDNPITILAQLGEKSATAAGSNSLDALNSCSQVEIRNKMGVAIGARMGRPEKAEERRMRPPVQVLFPVGRTLATERRMEKVAKSTHQSALLEAFDLDIADEVAEETEDIGVELELVSRECLNCGNETFESRCERCGKHTELRRVCLEKGCGEPVDKTTGECQYGHRATKRVQVNIQRLLDRVKNEIGEPQSYDLRAVLGLTSNLKIPEYLGKGILRAKHDVYCYRDGTARFDVTDAPLTHFKPSEVGVSVSKLHELGYTNDYQGAPLVSDTQTLELKVQDLIIPENGADYLVRVGKFVDDCLEKIYGLDRYYKFNLIEDVVGQLVIGLAPHTSAGIIGRVVGFTNASVCYAHPYWHAAKRRNCDGDEDALILVLDALINFSKEYLPAGRGGFMDAPLVLSVVLNPEEVDDESHNIEVCHRYPAEFYGMVAEAQHPKAVRELVDIIQSRLGTEAQYEGFGFTHDTSSIDAGPRNTKYKTLGSMSEKLEAQLHLAILLDAVDSQDVAERVLSHHFIRDIRGNLRAYSTQKIRCRKCNTIYRRVPLSGKCEECGEGLLLTVSQKNISKYLGVAEKLIRDHDLSQYLKQRLTIINSALDSLFVSEQTSLVDFMKE